jgi:hypothetical protein
MDYLQNGFEQLNPLAMLLTSATLFLAASIAGWYVGNVLLGLRR